ncbi:hypothetical protein LguiB_026718 [Lonicera macranthoides]
MIIITTRNKEVLRALEQTCHIEAHPEVYRSCKPDLMDHNDSLELFSKYAFMSKSPLKGYDILSKNVISTATGLPLALVITWSLLFGETNKYLWEEKFKELNRVPTEKVLEKLRLSYDPLGDVTTKASEYQRPSRHGRHAPSRDAKPAKLFRKCSNSHERVIWSKSLGFVQFGAYHV